MDFTIAEQQLSGKRMKLGEVNVSPGKYVKHEVIEEAFGLKGELPRGWMVAPNQPFPCDRGIYRQWLMFGLAMGLIYLGAAGLSDSADPWVLVYGLGFLSVIPIGALMVNHSFDVKRWSESDHSPYTSDD